MRQGVSPSLLGSPPPSGYFRRREGSEAQSTTDHTSETDESIADKKEEDALDGATHKWSSYREALRQGSFVGLVLVIALVYTLANL